MLQLENGTVVVENKGESNVLISTRRFHIEPNSTAPSKTYVAIRTDNSTYIEALTGDVRIRELPFDDAYLLPAGKNTLVPANALGVPGLQRLPANVARTTPIPSPPEIESKPVPAPGVHSHNTTIIILGVAAGGGIAGVIAALSGGGGSNHPPVSPSAP